MAAASRGTGNDIRLAMRTRGLCRLTGLRPTTDATRTGCHPRVARRRAPATVGSAAAATPAVRPEAVRVATGGHRVPAVTIGAAPSRTVPFVAAIFRPPRPGTRRGCGALLAAGRCARAIAATASKVAAGGGLTASLTGVTTRPVSGARTPIRRTATGVVGGGVGRIGVFPSTTRGGGVAPIRSTRGARTRAR